MTTIIYATSESEKQEYLTELRRGGVDLARKTSIFVHQDLLLPQVLFNGSIAEGKELVRDFVQGLVRQRLETRGGRR